MSNPIYPRAIFKPLPEATTQARLTPRTVILHTNGGGNSANGFQLWNYMNRLDVKIESHFQIDLDGTVWQYIPVNVRADANYLANPWAVSIETQDKGYFNEPFDSTPWTDWQVASIITLLAWLRDEWSIQMTRCTSWVAPGVGAHRDYPEWSAAGHNCPGAARFAQVPGIIRAAALFGTGHNPKPPTSNAPIPVVKPVGKFILAFEEDEMAGPLHRIVSPTLTPQILRWPSGLLGWEGHAEAFSVETKQEDDEATFLAFIAGCTVPPVPQEQITRK